MIKNVMKPAAAALAVAALIAGTTLTTVPAFAADTAPLRPFNASQFCGSRGKVR